MAIAPLLLRHCIPCPYRAHHGTALALTGFLVQRVCFGLAYLLMKRGMNTGTAAIIMALQPILVAACAPLAGAALPGRWAWPCLVHGFPGALFVILAGGSLGSSPAASVLLAFAALFGITAAALFVKWHGLTVDIAAPAAAATESSAPDWQQGLFVALAYRADANSIVLVGLCIALLLRGAETRISALLYLVPPLAPCVARVVLGERVTAPAFAGFADCVMGVCLVYRKAA